MISSAQWVAYNKAVESIVEGSRGALEAEITEWVGGHPGAGTAEIRREAERMMRGRVQEADKAAASLAAQWYDAQGRASGMRLDRAVTSVAFDEATVERVAHYQAQKLEDGDIPGFVEMCSELVGNDAVRSLNATIMRNAARDKRRGVKFARVTSGRNTCPWCLMLAGRGAVYHTRESAGAMGQFHRHCSCKIVPSFSGDKYEVLVEGHDPKDAERWSKRVESRERISFSLDLPSERELEKDSDLLDAAFKSNPEAVLADISSIGAVSAEPGCHIRGKELQEAKWMAALGHDVHFRDPDKHISSDGNTSDVEIDGDTWDFKRITSGNPNKIAQNIIRKVRQGPNFLIDLTLSSMKEGEALCKAASVLDEDGVNSVLVITRTRISLLKK